MKGYSSATQIKDDNKKIKHLNIKNKKQNFFIKKMCQSNAITKSEIKLLLFNYWLMIAFILTLYACSKNPTISGATNIISWSICIYGLIDLIFLFLKKGE